MPKLKPARSDIDNRVQRLRTLADLHNALSKAGDHLIDFIEDQQIHDEHPARVTARAMDDLRRDVRQMVGGVYCGLHPVAHFGSVKKS